MKDRIRGAISRIVAAAESRPQLSAVDAAARPQKQEIIELIRLFVKAKIHEQMRAKTARQDRFDQGSGRRDDNPITPETVNLFKEYRQRIFDRMPGGAVKLYRVGKVR